MAGRKVLASLGYDVDTKGIKDATKDLKKLKDQTLSTQVTFKGMAKSSGMVIGAIAATSAAFGSMYLKAVDVADAIDKQSKMAGIGAERFQTLTFAMDQMGLSQEQVTNMMKDYTGKLGQALDGNKTMEKSYNDLGIAIRDVNGEARDGEDVFDDAVKVLGQYENAAERSAAASKLFGEEGGRRLSSALGQGSAAIFDLENKARAAGAVLSNEAILGATQFKDELATLSGVIKTQFTKGLLEASPALLEVIESMTKDPQKIKDFGESIGNIASMMAKAAGATMTFVNAIGFMFSQTGKEYRELQRIEQDIIKLQKHISSGIELSGPSAEMTGMAGSAEELEDRLAKLVKRQEELSNKVFPTATIPTATTPTTDVVNNTTKQTEEVKTLGNELINFQRQMDLTLSAMMSDNTADEQIAKLKAQFSAEKAIQLERIQSHTLYKDNKVALDKEYFAWVSMREAEVAEQVKKIETEKADLVVTQRARALDAYREYYNSRNAAAEELSTESPETEMYDVAKNAQHEFFQQGIDGFAEMVVSGETNHKKMMSGILKNIGQMIIKQTLLNALMGTSFGQSIGFGGGGGTPVANAKGGVFTGKRNYNAGNTMGEQGAESIMPLRRDSQGRLGVSAVGKQSEAINIGGITVMVNGGGDPAENQRQSYLGTERAMNEFFDRRMAHHSKTGGMLRPTRRAGTI